jgi:TolB-like protein
MTKMTKSFVIFSLLILIAFNTIAQPVFQKNYATTVSIEGIFAGPANGSGILICGRSIASPYDAMLMKTDLNGTLQWAKTYGGSQEDIFEVARPTTDGGYIAVGKTKSFGAGDYDVLLTKFDANGNVTWTKTYGTNDGDWGSDVKQSADGGYIITGSSRNSSSVTQGSIYLIKTNSSGVITWSTMWGNQMGFEGISIFQTTDGGYLCGGRAGNGFNILIKTNNLGVITWARNNKAQTLQSVNLQQVIQTADGGYAIVGQGSALNNDWLISLAKTDASGVMQWTKTFTTPSSFAKNIGDGILQAWDGSFLIVGQSEDNPSGLLFLRTSSTGTLISAKVSTAIGSQNYSVLRLSRTSDGGFVAASANNGVFLMKSDGYGNTGCTTSNATITENTPTYFDTQITTLTNSGTTITNSPTITGTTITLNATTLCTGTDIEENMLNDKVSILPNPNSGKFIVKTQSINELHQDGEIEIYNMIGEKVYTSSFNQQLSKEIDFTNTAKGVYFIKVSYGDKFFTEKIVIQ